MKKEDAALFVILAAAALLLAFALYSAIFGGGNTKDPQPSGLPAECGDITNPTNVQHLSHHPQLYGACIKLVDPAIFKQAVGTDKATYMNQNGIN